MSDVTDGQRSADGESVDDTPTIEAMWWARLRLTAHRVRHPSLLRDIARERPFDAAVWLGLWLLMVGLLLVHVIPALMRFQVAFDLIGLALLAIGVPTNIWHGRRARRAAAADAPTSVATATGTDTDTGSQPGR